MVHLVRTIPPHPDGTPRQVDVFLQLVAEWRREGGGELGTWTRRRPRRETDLAGGSVYFTAGGWTVFRMPFVRIERVGDFNENAAAEWANAWAIVCRPEPVMVRGKRIYRLRGWRYLPPADTPGDV